MDLDEFISDYTDSTHNNLEDYLKDPDVTYIEDDLSAWADAQVPIYTTDAVKKWLVLGCPDVSDPGLIEGVTDVTKIIQTALYEHYSNLAHSIAQEAGLLKWYQW